MSGGGLPNTPGGGNVSPFNPGGQVLGGATDAQSLATLQSILQTLNAILTQLKSGVSLVATLPTFVFANLPAAATSPGMMAFVSNGRKPGEGAGLGTGMSAFSDGVNWYGTNGTILQV